KYIFSTDHKIIGIQYGLTSLFFLLFGFGLMMLMRWQLAYPGQVLPGLGNMFGQENMPGGIMLPQFYNQLGAMHGTIMVFLGVVPLGFGGFGNYLVPLQIGAKDMAFPRLNMLSYWIFFVAGILMLLSFFLPGGPTANGWTAYPPLADMAHDGQTIWLFGMFLIIVSSLFSSINVIVTIFQLRAPGMTFERMPFLVWAQLVTAFLLLLAFPPLEGAAFMQLFDRLLGTSFFLPSGLAVAGQTLTNYSGGGNALLWQHLFWFLGHPEVYVIILPALGIVTEIIANNTRKAVSGFNYMRYSVIFLGFLSFIVWSHHMYLTGMGTNVTSFFQTTTMMVSIPSVIVISALFITLWGGSIRFNSPMLFALAFLPMFGFGGLTGLPLGLATTDVPLHDTYYVIGHFHYVVAPGVIFAIFAGIYYWFPKATGRKMNEFLGRLHFWPTLICMNLIFFPMMIQGIAGVNRRLYDGGESYLFMHDVLYWNVIISWAVWVMAIAQVPFIFNFFWSIFSGEKVTSDNPWESTTLEWATPTPPPHGNFIKKITVYRGPYGYSLEGAPKDYSPQDQKDI
ncbi:MAG: cbb3-type cytochrome c oxidase subunit I, partial [Candidatus Omnitrophica bacterium]|nr:cbb3-type cytochrome c oxidase subunit I [Candidatus Omnitrophota bacterium]